MQIKDYYSILGVAPSATAAEIKRAYRKLAQVYHPDKTSNDAVASAFFTDVKEAYEVLTNPSKKERYLQQRWFNQSAGFRRTRQVITPDSVLQQVIELERYVSRLDHFRMDREGLKQYVEELLNPDVISRLNDFHDQTANDAIARSLLKTVSTLPFEMASVFFPLLLELNTSKSLEDEIDKGIVSFKSRTRKEKYTVLVILFLTLIICVAIFLLSN